MDKRNSEIFWSCTSKHLLNFTEEQTNEYVSLFSSMIVDEGSLRRLWGLLNDNSSNAIQIRRLCEVIDFCDEDWIQEKYKEKWESLSAAPKPISKENLDPESHRNVAKILQGYSLTEDTAKQLASKYLRNGTFSMEDLTAALGHKRLLE